MSENNNTPQANDYNRVDSNGLLYIFQRIKALFVAKESGKGLSTNDYTTAEKQKLGGIAAGAQVNVIESVKVNGTAQTVTSKAVDIAVPVVDSALSGSSTNTIQNKVVKGALDAKAPIASPTFTGTPLITTTPDTADNSHKIADTAYVKAAIAAALSGQLELHFSFLQTLPASGVEGTFYFIPATESESGVDEWEEYVWDAENEKFERVGAATLDLTDYFNTTNLPAITNSQIEDIIDTAFSDS